MPYKREIDAVHESAKSWKVQKKPWVKPLGYSAYTRNWQFVSSTPVTEIAASCAAMTWFYPTNHERELLRERAYAALMKNVEPAKAELLTGLAEADKTMSMVMARVTQLRKGVASLKRGNLRGFLDTIKIPEKARSRRHLNRISSDPRWVAKNAGALWLEYWLGWAPTIGDIHNATQVFTRQFDAAPVRGRASASPQYVSKSGILGTHDSTLVVRSGKVACEVGGKIRITNPNVLLAKELGLLNPLATAWELVPLSFVVNWFVNVGGVINRLDDWYGLEFYDSYETIKRDVYITGVSTRGYNGRLVTEQAKADAHFIDRDVPYGGIPPRLRAGTGISSLSRAATAISLLVQNLGDLPPPRR